MVDFAKLNADRYEAASPQERVRIDTAKANAEIEDAATRPLRARFAREAHDGEDFVPVKSWERDVHVRIDRDRESWNGESRKDVLVFSKAVTGYESFELDADMRGQLGRAEPGEAWAICAGGSSWNACRVDMADVAAFVALDDVRRERLVRAAQVRYAPETMDVAGSEAADGRFVEGAPSVPLQVSVLRLQPDPRGGLGDVLVIDGHGTPLTDAKRQAIRDADDHEPFSASGLLETWDGPAVPAGTLRDTVARADRHWATAMAAIARDVPSEHSIAVAGAGRVTAAVVQGATAPELRMAGGAVNASIVLTHEALSGIAALDDGSGVRLATTAPGAARDGAPIEARADDLKRVLAHERLLPDRTRDRRAEVDHGAPEPRLTNPRAVGAAIAALPGASSDKEGRRSVPVQVARSDLEAALGRGDGKGGTIGDQRYGAALNFFVDAIRQPTFKEFKPTGEVREGVAGLSTLMDGFGSGGHRKLWLDPAAMAALVASPADSKGRRRFVGADGPALLADLLAGTATREGIVSREKAARDAAKPMRTRTAGAKAEGAER